MKPAVTGLLWLIPFVCQAQSVDDFREKLYPVLEKAQCRVCHNDNGVASRTRLQFPPENAAPEEIAAFALRLSRLVDRGRPEESLLLQKPTNRVQHTGGERIRPGSPEEQALVAWVRYLAGLPEEKLTTQAGPAKSTAGEVRRLTHSQYNQTVADLLGDQTRPGDQFPGEDYINGFTNQAAGQSVTPVQQEAYNSAAAKLARNAFRGGDSHGLIPCRPSSPEDAGCRQRFILEFGRRAFRRPLTPAESARYGKLFLAEASATHDFSNGARLVVEAMLQSPNFLFHLEQGPEGTFEPYRTASRLSYFLWDTMPDESLFQAAARGELNTQAQIRKVARRLLDDPRARQSMDVFLAQWLRFDRLKSAIRDHRFYPDFSTELAAAMMEETRRLFDHLVWDDGDFTEFFSANYSYLNNDLAQLYGVRPPAREFARVDFPADSKRAGVVGQAAFLSLTSKPADTSPTERGIFVREHFLCQIVPPPPAGVNTVLPPPTDEQPMTNRQRLSVHLSNQACSACHGLIDPIGFGLEHFDAIGRYREQHVVTIFPTFDEMVHRSKTKPTEHRLPLDVTAFVRGIPNSEFSTPRALGEILGKDPACQKCVVKQLFRYALGRPETADDQPAIDGILREFQESKFRFKSLIIGIIGSQTFLGGGT